MALFHRGTASPGPLEPRPARAILLLAVLACAAGCGPSRPSPSPTRNVLLIVADTLRADRLGCYGYERDTSPTIDALAEEGVLYERCYSQGCWTVPSMISMMSGLSVTQLERRLPRVTLLAEHLQAHGLRTSAFLANATLGVDRGFERGFDDFEPLFNERAPDIADAFGEWLEGWRAGREAGASSTGFFAWVHFLDPHHPYKPGKTYNVFGGQRHDLSELVPRWRAELPRVAELSPSLDGLSFEQAVNGMNGDSNRYDGEVRAVDEGVRRILDSLRESGELERTLIVFCSDHGEMLYEHPHYPFLLNEHVENEGGLPGGVADLFVRGHRPWYYEDLWNVPLILVGPGLPAGARRGGLAANLDIYPTILEALDLPSPGRIEGQSLLGGREPERERVFAFGHRTSAVLDDRGRKLILHFPERFTLDPESSPRVELFDIQADPRELSDLSADRAEEAEELRLAIEAWHRSSEREVDATETEASRRTLIEMGYIGEDD